MRALLAWSLGLVSFGLFVWCGWLIVKVDGRRETIDRHIAHLHADETMRGRVARNLAQAEHAHVTGAKYEPDRALLRDLASNEIGNAQNQSPAEITTADALDRAGAALRERIGAGERLGTEGFEAVRWLHGLAAETRNYDNALTA
ncbi:MAG: hypothetical protein OER88_06625, partial [Planctomycetota bacterium]|nr:hypothetical protein [Planctomycetota bacterium]